MRFTGQKNQNVQTLFLLIVDTQGTRGALIHPLTQLSSSALRRARALSTETDPTPVAPL